jgi:hypothetical protein
VLNFLPIGISLSSTPMQLSWEINCGCILLIFGWNFYNRSFFLSYIGEVSKFLQFHFMLLNVYGKFYSFILNILLYKTLREEHKCFLLSQG